MVRQKNETERKEKMLKYGMIKNGIKDDEERRDEKKI